MTTREDLIVLHEVLSERGRQDAKWVEKRISHLSPEERKVARREFWAKKKAACGLKVRYP